MSGNIAAQQSLAKRFATALRQFEHEGGSVDELAKAVGEEARDLRRWADGTKMPAHVLSALLGELPRHHADYLIAPTGLRLIARDEGQSGNALRAAATACDFSRDVATRMADGTWDHRDAEAARKHAQRVISELQPIAGE
jgi:sugar phosphate isomerase/epimerase